jgi:hypothetical protein
MGVIRKPKKQNTALFYLEGYQTQKMQKDAHAQNLTNFEEHAANTDKLDL